MKDRNETQAQRETRLSAFERDAMPIDRDKWLASCDDADKSANESGQWELKTVTETPWVQDDSGVYVLVSWRPAEEDCRLDVMTVGHGPVVSFAGSADNVRKYAMQWLGLVYDLSLEHAAYIGHELCRADHLKTEYVQDATDNIVLIVTNNTDAGLDDTGLEHDPETCGCKYRGSDMWSCGHIDNQQT